MSQDFDALPPAVREALWRGRPLDAIRLLCQARHISLKGAAQQIEAVVRQGIPPAPPPPAAPWSPLGSGGSAAGLDPRLRAPGEQTGSRLDSALDRLALVLALAVAVYVLYRYL